MDVKFDVCGRLLISSDGGSFTGDGILIVEFTSKNVDKDLHLTCNSGNSTFWSTGDFYYVCMLVLGLLVLPLVLMACCYCSLRKLRRCFIKVDGKGDFRPLSQNDSDEGDDENDVFRDVEDDFEEDGVEMRNKT